MRYALLLTATLLAGLSVASSVRAGDGGLTDYTVGSCDSCNQNCGGCRLHRHRGGHHGCGHLRRYEGLDLNFNCGCQGSYNYPVPPQFTYHWPGTVYKQVLMTDYHSPWRFPPIKPYTEEVLVPQGAQFEAEATLRPVSASHTLATPTLPAGQIEPMSAMMERFFR